VNRLVKPPLTWKKYTGVIEIRRGRLLKSIYQFATQIVAKKRELPRGCDPFITLANDARKRIREIGPREMAKLKQSPVIIDIRENDEFVLMRGNC